jgi:hypothetical protein
LVNSPEFHIFAREKGDVEKVLGALAKERPMQILQKYRKNFKIKEEQDITSLTQYKEAIIDFQIFLKKCMSVMKVSDF